MVEISSNEDYTEGIKEAIDKLDKDSKDNDYLFDASRQRILMKMKYK